MCMMSDTTRFASVLRKEYLLFGKVLNDKEIEKYVEEILIVYNDLKNDLNKFESIYRIYLEFAIAINSIYKYLLLHNVSKDKALELLSILFINTTDKVLDRLSFIQLAFHYSTNKEYLKLIIINSLTTLDGLNIANELKEHSMDNELSCSMKDCNIEEYFMYYNVKELMQIVMIAENSLINFLDKNFNSLNDNKNDSVILKIIK